GARVAVHPSGFGAGGRAQRGLLIRSANSLLRVVTEDVVISEPGVESKRNPVPAANLRDPQALANDRAPVRGIGWLKWRFMTQAEGLIHEDLHPGSVIVRPEVAADPGSTTMSDSEFAFCSRLGSTSGLAGRITSWRQGGQLRSAMRSRSGGVRTSSLMPGTFS
ncbi:MAG: hypothetical protein ACYDD0_02740, partial [Candidatus Dormibacteria bacterium]